MTEYNNDNGLIKDSLSDEQKKIFDIEQYKYMTIPNYILNLPDGFAFDYEAEKFLRIE